MLLFIQHNECGSAYVVRFDVFKCRLRRVHGVDNDVIERRTARGDGDVVFKVYAAEIALQKKYEDRVVF